MKKFLSILLALALCLGLGAYVLDGTAAADGLTGFTDVPDGAYYAAPVKWAVEKGITNGTGGGAFSPDAECTTAQIITFLWRAMGKPAPNISNPFNDVKDGEFYYQAALWAREKGLVSGTTFGPGTPCTRSQTVTYLWICAGRPSAKQASFSDVSSGADYAAAVSWAVEKGITTGTSATAFSPDNTCTRGQIVTFLHRDLGGAAMPDNSGTQRMARAMLDKLAELGDPEAYLVDMNADGTPELACNDDDIEGSLMYSGGYRVFRWDGQKLYEHEFDYPDKDSDFGTSYGQFIVQYGNEYALVHDNGAGGMMWFYFYFLDRTERLAGGTIPEFGDDGEMDFIDSYSYNGKDISEQEYSRLCKEFSVDNFWESYHKNRVDLPAAKPELMKLLAA